MSYKVYIYALVLITTAFSFSGLNFKDIFKTNHEVEAKIFVMLLIMSVSYLVSSFIISFIEVV